MFTIKVTLIGIDLAKSVFQICGVNQAGKPIFNRKIRRNKLIEQLMCHPEAEIAMEAPKSRKRACAGIPEAEIAMEACSGSN